MTPWTTLGTSSSDLHYPLEFNQIHDHESEMISNPFHCLLHLLLLPSVFLSIRVFSSELALHIRWPNYWSFSFSLVLPMNYSGLISFRIDWFDLLAVQGTLKSLLQHHNWKPSILQHSTFLMVQLSHPWWLRW